MILSDVCIKRPVFAAVLSLLLVVFGLVSFNRLALREYPDIDPPVVSIETVYPGAAANVVETRITELVEDRISGIEGIEFIQSSSEDGQSRITIEFGINRDLDGATNDIRDRVFSILDDLPEEADPPQIRKVDSNENVIMWLNLTSDRLSVPELTDYAKRYLVDRFSVLDGVARVRIGGGQEYAMRIWLNREALAARGLAVQDVESALRSDNIELPAGSIESRKMQFTIRLKRSFLKPADFEKLAIGRGEDGYVVRLSDVARVERGTVEDRTFFRGNKVPMVGLGIIKQSTANTIDVARAAKKEKDRLNPLLPEGMIIRQSYDTSLFIEDAIAEVFKTLAIAIMLVILVIYLFLGTLRATLIPAVTVPVSLIATFTVLLILGFSVNLLTLLALVLAIGLVVDDAIVVLENIFRRIQERHETPLVAAFLGTREVAFAVIATTMVLASVFVPIAFLTGDVGRLFREFALTMVTAVVFSSIVALSLSPMIASKLLRKGSRNESSGKGPAKWVDNLFGKLRGIYTGHLRTALKLRPLMMILFLLLAGASWLVFKQIPAEYAPKEDRGAFFLLVNGPEGATYEYMESYMDEIEKRLMPLVENGEVRRLLVRTPRSFGNIETFNSGIVIVVLNDFSKRRNAFQIMGDVRKRVGGLPGVRAFPVMRQGFGNSIRKPVQFVIGGGTYEQLAEWRDILVSKINENNPGFVGLDWDYKETKPQIEVQIDYNRAAELGVPLVDVGRTLETMLGSRRVTTFIESGEEYDVVVEGERSNQRTPTNLTNIYVRSERSSELIPLSNLVILKEFADSTTLNRYNRVRSVTLEANLKEGFILGDALDHLNQLVEEHLPEEVIVDYKGLSRDYQTTGRSVGFVFVLGLVVVFLILAAQFESWIHPFIVMTTVPLAVAGGLLGLWLTGGTLNIYSQIGLIMLVGLAAKNGILIVEFANQLRDRGKAFEDALVEASATRLRPILMTGITTAAGSIPLILSTGAGSETRFSIGIVVLFGVLLATFLTVFSVPVAYSLFARNTRPSGDVARRLEQELEESNSKGS